MSILRNRSSRTVKTGKRLLAGGLTQILLAVALFGSSLLITTLPVHAEGVIVCIDPGHGGEDQGASYSGYDEKDLDFQIASAMYQELSQYEGITVYMTRYGDDTLSLKQRAQIAKGYGAEFLYSIHINACNDHSMFGSEVWISAYDNHYAKGRSFGEIAENELETQVGVYSKGVKTKLSANGKQDFYGIIRHSRSCGVTGVIIEHCYMDNDHDTGYAFDPDTLIAFGKADATAVAKYYGLKSTALGKDYSGYKRAVYKAPKAPVMQDVTPPEYVKIELTEYDAAGAKASFHVWGKDPETKIIYYNYSCDGGATWSRLHGWTAETEGYLTIPVTGNDVVIALYNRYCGGTQSNHVILY